MGSSYPRPSKEPHSTAGAVQATGQLSLRDLMAITNAKPSKLLTPYGVEKGGWEAFERRAAWLSLAALVVMTVAIYVTWFKFDVRGPSLRLLGFTLYVIPWTIGIYIAGRRRLSKYGWLVATVLVIGLLVFALFIYPALAHWLNDVLTSWIVGPDMVVDTIDPLHLN